MDFLEFRCITDLRVAVNARKLEILCPVFFYTKNLKSLKNLQKTFSKT